MARWQDDCGSSRLMKRAPLHNSTAISSSNCLAHAARRASHARCTITSATVGDAVTAGLEDCAGKARDVARPTKASRAKRGFATIAFLARLVTVRSPFTWALIVRLSADQRIGTTITPTMATNNFS